MAFIAMHDNQLVLLNIQICFYHEKLKAIGPRSNLRGGGSELGKLKPKHMAPTKLHNIKLKYAI